MGSLVGHVNVSCIVRGKVTRELPQFVERKVSRSGESNPGPSPYQASSALPLAQARTHAHKHAHTHAHTLTRTHKDMCACTYTVTSALTETQQKGSRDSYSGTGVRQRYMCPIEKSARVRFRGSSLHSVRGRGQNNSKQVLVVDQLCVYKTT